MNEDSGMTTIGHWLDTDQAAELSLEQLIAGRAGVVANSGAGKSYLLRVILEQSHGRAQHLVLDPEDEMYTLRERFDYVLAGGADADCPATPDNAGPLARALLELGVSAIIQLNDLDLEARRTFVRHFLNGLINAPRSLWHPTLVVLDEAHVFAPQHSPAESLAAVSRLMSQGRKRSFAGILTTQRLSRLNKDCTGEIQNWFIGRVGQALDRRVAMDQLGFSPSGTEAQQIMRCPPGEFWAFGPAISIFPQRLRVGEAATRHLQPGQARVPTPPPPEHVKMVLQQLTSRAEPQAEVAAGRRDAEALRSLQIRCEAAEAESARLRVELERAEAQLGQLRTAVPEALAILGEAFNHMQAAADLFHTDQRPAPSPKRHRPPHPAPRVSSPPSGDDRERVLGVLAAFRPTRLTRRQLAALARVKHSSLEFRALLAGLRDQGQIRIHGDDTITLAEDRADTVGSPATALERIHLWGTALRHASRSAKPAEMLDILCQAWPKAMSRDDLARRLKIRTDVSTFSVVYSALAKHGLAERQGSMIRAADHLFEGLA